jgi:CRP-like cAMP-binding protein
MTLSAPIRTVGLMFSFGSLHDGKIDRLRQSDAFRHCTPDELRRVARAGELVRIRAGEAIHPQGAPLNWCYVVVEGEAATRGRTVAAGSTYGDAQILVRDRHGADALVAVTDVEVMTIPRRNFVELVESIPRLSAVVSRSLAERLAVAANPGLVPLTVS